MAKILDVLGRQVWDSRGRPTVEAEVVVGRGTTALARGRAIAPAGASTGSGEAQAIEPRKAVESDGNDRIFTRAPHDMASAVLSSEADSTVQSVLAAAAARPVG